MLMILFFIEIEVICLDSRIAIVSMQLNGINYCYLARTVLFDINHLFAESEVFTSIAI